MALVQVVRRSFLAKGADWSRTLRQIGSSPTVHRIFDISKEEEFKTEVLSADKPVIVDFHASWCGPCRTLGPDLEAVVREHSDKVHLAKVDVDQLPELAMAHNITSIPAVLAFKQGSKKTEFVGAQNLEFLKRFVSEVIST